MAIISDDSFWKQWFSVTASADETTRLTGVDVGKVVTIPGTPSVHKLLTLLIPIVEVPPLLKTFAVTYNVEEEQNNTKLTSDVQSVVWAGSNTTHN